jgi:TrbC/VIRB2 pilin
MNKRKLLTALATFGPLMLCAAAAFAATSGLPVDPTITTFTNFISTDVAYGLVGAGFAGIATHCVTGRDFGFTMQHSVGALVGGGLCSQVTPAAAALGLSAGALIHLVH